MKEQSLLNRGTYWAQFYRWEQQKEHSLYIMPYMLGEHRWQLGVLLTMNQTGGPHMLLSLFLRGIHVKNEYPVISLLQGPRSIISFQFKILKITS